MKLLYEIRGATFRYPQSDIDVLVDINLDLYAGQILCILGANGAGKSTLLNCMAALEKPQKGEFLLGGEPLHRQSPQQVAKMIGYVQQTNEPAFSYPVYQYVMMGRAPHVRFFSKPSQADEDIVWQALEELDLLHLANRPYTDISGGERQKCVIARALVQRPRILLFDEPTAHLDYGNQAQILHLIKSLSQQGYAVVMTTHNPDHALLLNDQVAILNSDGRLRQGGVSDILDEPTLQQMYNTDLRLLYIEEINRNTCLLADIPTPKEENPL